MASWSGDPEPDPRLDDLEKLAAEVWNVAAAAEAVRRVLHAAGNGAL